MFFSFLSLLLSSIAVLSLSHVHVDALAAAGLPHRRTTENHRDHNDDWLQAEQTLREFPGEPHLDLSAKEVVMGCLRCLQMVDHPTEGIGLVKIYPFLTWNCIKHVVGENTQDGTLGGMERFCQRGSLSPVLQTFFGATQINTGTKKNRDDNRNNDDDDECTRIPGTPTRGEILIFPIRVTAARVMSFQHKSGMIKDGISQSPPSIQMIVRVERQRRPPLSGCWLIRDIIDARYAGGGNGWSRDEGV